MKRTCGFYIVLMILLSVVGCTTDGYDTGDGKYSKMRAEFVEIHADNNKRADYAVTDNSEQLIVDNPFTLSWMTKADSTYRALLYYNPVATSSSVIGASVVSAVRVPVLPAVDEEEYEKIKTDPLTFESVWLSLNKKYLNIGFSLKTGRTDDDAAKHSLGIIVDGTTIMDDGSRCAELRLYHDQGSIPEYYSVRGWASVRLSDINADAVRIRINSYKGEVTKVFNLNQ